MTATAQIPGLFPTPDGLPQVGIHRDVPFDQYAAWPAINSGVLKWGMISMKHMKAAVDGKLESDDTSARRVGRAIHMRLLEPERFVLLPVASRCTTPLGKSSQRAGEACGASGKAMYMDEWFCGTHAPKGAVEPSDYLTEDEHAEVEGVAASLHDSALMRHFARPGWSEASVLWGWNGLLLKGRIDRLCEGGDLIIDVKSGTAGELHRTKCRRAVENYGWHRQAAMYVKGVAAEIGREPQFIWVFVEKTPPFDVNVLPASKQDISIGWDECEMILSAYRRATDKGKFPGYISDPKIPIEAGALSAKYVENHLRARG